MSFYDTFICTSRVHCKTCRDLGKGLDFRRQMEHDYEVHGGENFWCPEDRPWTGSLDEYNELPTAQDTRYHYIRKMILSLPDDNENAKKMKGWMDKAMEDLKEVSACSSCAETIRQRIVKSWDSMERRYQLSSLILKEPSHV